MSGTGPHRGRPAPGGLDLSAPKRPHRGPQPPESRSQEGGETTTTTRHTPTAADCARLAPARLVDQQEAAALAGCSKDTIVRARRAGRLPHSRLYGRRWLVAVDDLAAADLLPPDQATPQLKEAVVVATAGTPAAVELARAEARLGALEDLLARQDDELRFLRQLAADQLRRAS